MNRSTTSQITSPHQPCSDGAEAGECVSGHRHVRLFPHGERNRLRRGHQFVTESMLSDIPSLYETEQTDCADKTLLAHYFVGGADWYVAELEANTGNAFGYADLGCGEWGYFSVVELENTQVNGWLVVERDLHFKPTTARELGIASLSSLRNITCLPLRGHLGISFVSTAVRACSSTSTHFRTARSKLVPRRLLTR